MAYTEIPSDDQVVEALRKLSGHATAVALCKALEDAGHPRRDSQLAIQRAAERGRLVLQPDWSVRVAQEAVAA